MATNDKTKTTRFRYICMQKKYYSRFVLSTSPSPPDTASRPGRVQIFSINTARIGNAESSFVPTVDKPPTLLSPRSQRFCYFGVYPG